MKNKLSEGWKEVELGEVFEFQSKSKIKAGEGNSKGKYKFFTSSGTQSKFIDEAVFEGEYLIFSTGGSAGVHYCNEKFSTSTDCFVVKVNTKLISKYAYYYFLTNIHLLKAGFKGAGLKHISKEYIKKIKILFPERKEIQQKIVSILEKTEKAKKLRKEADELTKDFLKAIFIEMFGDRKKFDKVRLGDIARLTMGGTPSTSVKEYWENGTINWMKSGDIKGEFIYSVPNRITKLGLDNSNTKIYPLDNVVIALNGQGKTRGTTAILKLNTTSNQSVAGILLEKNKAIAEYVHYNLKLRYQELRNLTGDDERSGLNLTLLRNLPIILPPIELQKKFASIVKEVEVMKEQQKHSKEHLDNLFNALMQKAFKGELIT